MLKHDPFHHHERQPQRLRDLAVNLFLLCVGEAVLVTLVEGAGLSVLASSAAVLFITTALNFPGAKFFAFGAR